MDGEQAKIKRSKVPVIKANSFSKHPPPPPARQKKPNAPVVALGSSLLKLNAFKRKSAKAVQMQTYASGSAAKTCTPHSLARAPRMAKEKGDRSGLRPVKIVASHHTTSSETHSSTAPASLRTPGSATQR